MQKRNRAKGFGYGRFLEICKTESYSGGKMKTFIIITGIVFGAIFLLILFFAVIETFFFEEEKENDWEF